MHEMKVSLNRTQVEEALAKRDTNLHSFIEAGQQQGKSMEEIWMDLRHISGVPFSVRTLYRWAESLEVAS